MTQDNYPTPISDPEAEGLPAYADDDSFADPDAPSSRVADGPRPAALPTDRPAGVEEFGITPEEMRQGESLDLRLSREEPDVTLTGEDPAVGADPRTGDPTGADTAGVDADLDLDLDEDVDRVDPDRVDAAFADEGADPRLHAILEAEDPATDSKLSVYERLGNTAADGTVGRLVEPDEGAHPDVEPDAIAYDRGPAGGGASAEELAIHEEAGPA